MTQKCPTCEAPVPAAAEHRPFCSARCKDVDLGKWFGEEFVVSRPMNLDEVQQVYDDEGQPRQD
ncbi:MAG: DNA gyrase inhibitor YacG [Deltaproteobacteria bacterium]